MTRSRRLFRFVAAFELVALFATAIAFGASRTSETSTARAQTGISVAIDADPSNGTGPCHPVDSTASLAGGSHEVAVCLAYAPKPIASFTFDLKYDDTLNQAPSVDCQDNCLDANPDANAGSTLGSGTPTIPDLGVGWDCSGGASGPPQGDVDPATGPGHGDAFISCVSPMGPYSSPVDAAYWPLAVVSFNLLASGTDTLTLQNLDLWGADSDRNYVELGSCDYDDEPDIPCYGATIVKTLGSPTNTATATQTPNSTPTQTRTPRPAVGGFAEPPDVAASSAGVMPSHAGVVAVALAGLLVLLTGARYVGTRRRG